MARYWRSFIFVPVIIAVCSILGGVFGPGLPGVSAASGEDEIKNSLRTFSEIYDTVERNFADELDPDRAIYSGAIPGMLHTLDPHSSFFDPRYFQLLREEQKGHYGGVGMYVGARAGKVIVITPFTGQPAYKAGIRPGDVILAVDGTNTEGMSTTEIADLLKGLKGTPVEISIGRPGSADPLIFNLIRDDITRSSVNNTFFIKPDIAYLSIEQFNENTSRDMERALDQLGEKNIKGLILDLRSNPGGLLNEGVAVAGRFLGKGQTVVKHRGRTSPEKPYLAVRGNRGLEYPIVVLVNDRSASAAEIVAGALQDHDRGWILGDNTFGKGLVQTVYPLSENTGLALTTARYYTPSGRLIQKDYENKSFYDYFYGGDVDTQNPLKAKMTDSGRTVYGGAGITPDEKFTDTKLNRFQRLLVSRYSSDGSPASMRFFSFTAKYFGTHSLDLPKDWTPDASVLNEFRQYLIEEGLKITEAEFEENRDWIRKYLRLDMYTTAFGIDESQRLTIETDPAVLQAIESLPKAQQLLDDAKRLIAQRRNGSQE